MKPPRLARRVLARAVPADRSGHSVMGDFDDEFAERARRDGTGRARSWYWRQAIAMWWWSAWSHPADSYHHPRGDMFSGLITDLRHAARVAAQSPGQTLLVVATLACGVGASTVGFAFADTAVIRGLPVQDPERTVMIFGVDTREPNRRGGVYMADVVDLRERARTVEALSTWTQGRATLIGASADPIRVTVSRVTGDLFGVWGIPAQLGRTLAARDSTAGAPRVAVVSDRFWRETLREDPAIVGRSLVVDAEPTTVVGVLSPDIEIGSFANVALWIADPRTWRDERSQTTMVTGRLAPGSSVGDAAAEFDVLAAALEREHPQTNRGRQLQVLTTRRAVGGPNFALVLSLLLGAAGLLVVIAATNVAGVLLARAVVRQREFALRMALGAGHARVFRQLTAEGLLLAALGAAGGVIVAEAALRVIRAVEAEPIFQQIALDWHELVFALVLALVTPVFFSLAPALSAVRPNVARVLSATSPRAGASGGRARDVLVVTQLALAVSLAIIGGLVVRTAAAMTWAPVGFAASELMSFTLAVQEHAGDGAARRAALRALLERLGANGLAAGTLDALPAAHVEATTVVAPDAVAAADQLASQTAHVVRVDASALSALGVPLLAGRGFDASDVDEGRHVALVTRAAAERYYGGVDAAIGRRLGIPQATGMSSYDVIGVTGDVLNTDTELGPPARVWLPLSDPRVASVVVRAQGGSAVAAPVIRQAAREVMPRVPVENLESYARGIARVQGGNRVAMGMLIGFVCVALVFAATGLYGTVALATNLRKGEFATRVALGATRADVAGLIGRHTARLVLLAVGPGLAGGLLVAQAMSGLLYGVTPLDPLNILSVLAVVGTLALIASIGPAWRATRANVVESLRP